MFKWFSVTKFFQNTKAQGHRRNILIFRHVSLILIIFNNKQISIKPFSLLDLIQSFQINFAFQI